MWVPAKSRYSHKHTDIDAKYRDAGALSRFHFDFHLIGSTQPLEDNRYPLVAKDHILLTCRNRRSIRSCWKLSPNIEVAEAPEADLPIQSHVTNRVPQFCDTRYRKRGPMFHTHPLHRKHERHYRLQDGISIREPLESLPLGTQVTICV